MGNRKRFAMAISGALRLGASPVCEGKGGSGGCVEERVGLGVVWRKGWGGTQKFQVGVLNQALTTWALSLSEESSSQDEASSP